MKNNEMSLRETGTCKRVFVGTTLLVALLALANLGKGGDQILVSSPMTTDLSGKTADLAYPSVYRIVCKGKGEGTGFLHKSGRVISAFHVVDGAAEKDIKILQIMPTGIRALAVTNVVTETNSDLALLAPAEPITAPCLPITTNLDFKIGSQVCTWGFPGGYSGLAPLLSAGYLSGIQWDNLPNGVRRPTFVVNAAFNGGNSGGPLLDVETGTVIGVVVSKLAPVPKEIEVMIDRLSKATQGMVYHTTYADGRKDSISEAQMVAKLANYLRSQVQLVIGYSATPGNLRNFLIAQGIEP
jgi:S1-C subfamily serine protease